MASQCAPSTSTSGSGQGGVACPTPRSARGGLKEAKVGEASPGCIQSWHEGEWSGERKPSSEWRMHAAIYKATKAQAVVHTHSDHCVALACQGRGLPGFHYLVGSFGGSDVPCVPYSTFGTEQLAEDAAAALDRRSACLLGAHGMICRGRDLANVSTFVVGGCAAADQGRRRHEAALM